MTIWQLFISEHKVEIQVSEYLLLSYFHSELMVIINNFINTTFFKPYIYFAYILAFIYYSCENYSKIVTLFYCYTKEKKSYTILLIFVLKLL